MILDIFKDSLEYGVKDIRNLVIMGVMGVFSFLIIPAFMLYGYSYRVIKTASNGMINGDEPLPDFSNWEKLFIDGIKVFAVKIIYNIIPIILGVIGFIYNPLVFILAILTFIIFDMFSMVAVAHMSVNNDSIKKAFKIKEIFNIFKSIGPLRYFGFFIGLIIINIVIISIFTAVILLIFAIAGGLSLINAVFLSISSGIVISAIIVAIFAYLLIVEPYILMINSRAIGLIYNSR